MTTPHVLIVGGGLAGLAVGSYARLNGYRTTIVEHGPNLGGVCTAWQRGAYTFDGGPRWLQGGAFAQLYEELGIAARVPLRPLDTFATWRHVAHGLSVPVGRDLGALTVTLQALFPADADAVARLVEAAREVGALPPPIDHPPEHSTFGQSLRALRDLGAHASTLYRYHLPVGRWVAENIQSPDLRALLTSLALEDSPMLFVLFVLGYLEKGWLLRPDGGSGALRDALVTHYRSLGGEALVNATVNEIVVRDDCAVGVRLANGTLLSADQVVSTASTPETVLHLLGGRYGAAALHERLETCALFTPIVVASYGVAATFPEAPADLRLDAIEPVVVGGHRNESLQLRIYNDAPFAAPPGHTVVQVIAKTDHDWWASCGPTYELARREVTEALLARVERVLPGVTAATRTTDLATPLTFWRNARAWRGAYEGWAPNLAAMTAHLPRTLPGLLGFAMAGQWVEPGGGVASTLLSARHLVQCLCAEDGRSFLASPSQASARRGDSPIL